MTYKTTGYKRRQYEDVARILGQKLAVLNTGHADGGYAAVLELSQQFADLFEQDNARFDLQRFNARVAEYAEGKR